MTSVGIRPENTRDRLKRKTRTRTVGPGRGDATDAKNEENKVIKTKN